MSIAAYQLDALHLIDHLTKQMDIGKIPINIYVYRFI